MPKRSRIDEIVENSNVKVTNLEEIIVSSPFEELANELLEQIFSFLDPTSLKNSLLVDKRWSAVISHSPMTMKFLPLTVGLRGTAHREIKDFDRSYQEVRFKNIFKSLPQYVSESLSRVGQHVKTIKYVRCGSYCKSLETLKLFPKVENIVFCYLQRQVPNSDYQLLPAQISNLKSLKLGSNSNVSFN
jgi:hypothetical protein